MEEGKGERKRTKGRREGKEIKKRKGRGKEKGK